MEMNALFYALVGGLLAISITSALSTAKDAIKPITGQRRAMIVFEEAGRDQNGELRMNLRISGLTQQELDALDESQFTAPAMAKRVYLMFKRSNADVT